LVNLSSSITMKKILLPFLIIIALTIQSNAQEKVNCLSLAEGTKIITLPESYAKLGATTAIINQWTAEAVQDDNLKNGWCSKKGGRGPFVFVFELSEDFLLEEVFFGNDCERTAGICTQNVKVEYSETSSLQNYIELGSWKLNEYQKQSFSVKPVKARWVRLSILSNYGNRDYTELMEFGINASFANYELSSLAIEGTWDSNWDWVSMKKNEHGYFYGCYKYNSGRLEAGKVNRRVFQFSWDERPIGGAGWATLVINKEGKILRGIWGNGTNHSQFGIWEFTYKNSEQYTCSNTSQMNTKIPDQYTIPVKKTETVVVNAPTTMRFVLTVLDESTGSPVEAGFRIFRKGEKNALKESFTDNKGKAAFSVPLHQSILIDVSKQGYMNAEQEMNVSNFNGAEITYTIKIKPVKVGESVVLKNVLFKQGTSIMLDSSYAALDKLIVLLNQNAGMEIELSGHTDNQGSQELNLKLSEERVRVVRDYLIHKGITAGRIQGKGYGGLKPLYDNSTETTRRLNRRVEFKILKM
jgi:outer membrane protein OmpA-like peptidoglycan-associated protein